MEFNHKLEMLFSQLGHAIGSDGIFLKGTLAIVSVALICGSVGPLVVGKRMAFFSDALGHCALAGIALGVIVTLLLGFTKGKQGEDDPLDWVLPPVMIAFGGLVGLGIIYVRDKTGLASDTVIGVFFSGAIGFGAILFGVLKQLTNRDADMFLFGSPNFIPAIDLIGLFVVAAVTTGFMFFRFNDLVFASFNPSLARSRRIPVWLNNYLFIVLLAFIVNLGLQAVGLLLINAVLIVPAAAASNISRNMRQLFWWTIGLSVAAGLGGQLISDRVSFHVRGT
ncbi:MAG TPA: metal ABC transporter permease, partial [Gemmataceae bacterium]|nr:metal ABC transporter permease [Gemmataceae bacterium]